MDVTPANGTAQPGIMARIGRMFGFGAATAESTDELETPFLYRSDRVVGERYRTLAWMMDQLRLKQNFQVLTVTSSVASEGKSTVAVNLAAVLSERAEHRVLLIDFDLRRPRLFDILGGDPPGLQELLEDRADFDSVLHHSDEVGFTYIPVITPMEDPLRLLSNSQRLQRIMAIARERYDYVILDAPPVLPVSDPLFLSEASDAVLFVVRAGETSGRMLSRSLSILKQEKLLGIVFNGTARGMGYRYDPYYRRKYNKGHYRTYR